ncbi:LysR family transcriptional regulator [Alteriqipengyuania lutimaris]|uniref:LysR family transcriptional regulator n=1 Tax=Alteriqipengyuania lutimaris TaxID=1538146 RepID=UPI0011C05E1C|nr:LysR substrate-binding domain-containing protein [Alteriqipengyuania lutimaris]MBB3034134.1 LysR family hydrogen peroxide-inducible transcriptional activator [Alteriqipengyuania lutimaris]
MPTLKQLEYFLAVIDHGGVGRAARVLNVSQPSLSQQLKELERRLGVKLIERKAGKNHTTPIGRLIIDDARAMAASAERIRRTCSEGARGGIGQLNLGVTPTIGPYLMPEVIRTIKARDMELELRIFEGLPHTEIDLLRTGERDIVIAQDVDFAHDLSRVDVVFESLFFVASKQHRLAKRSEPAQMSDLIGEQLLCMDVNHPLGRQCYLIAEQIGMIPNTSYGGTSLDTLRKMAGVGLGLALLPDLYLRSEGVNMVQTRRLEVADWTVGREIAAYWRQEGGNSPIFDVVTDLCREVATSMMESESATGARASFHADRGAPAARQIEV